MSGSSILNHFGIFTIASLAIAFSAMIKASLRFGNVSGVTFPFFQSLDRLPTNVDG